MIEPTLRMPRYFTAPEADALLSQVRTVMEEVQRRKLAFDQLQGEVEKLEGRLAGNGHLGESERLAERQEAVRQIGAQIAELVEKVQALGVEVKDLTTGLVDFRALREGREVYLCWRVGESRVEWWHPLEGGFATRQHL